MAINKARLRQLHQTLAPIMILPVLITLITGSLFQVAELTGHARDFGWLLQLHTGKFGMVNLRVIYPFLNTFGILMLATTGIIMWWQLPKRQKKNK